MLWIVYGDNTSNVETGVWFQFFSSSCQANNKRWSLAPYSELERLIERALRPASVSNALIFSWKRALLFGREPGAEFRVAEFRQLRLEVLGFSESLVKGFDLFGVEFVTCVVDQQRCERRDRDRGREVAGAADARNRHAFYEGLVARRVELRSVDHHPVDRRGKPPRQQGQQACAPLRHHAQARLLPLIPRVSHQRMLQ